MVTSAAYDDAMTWKRRWIETSWYLSDNVVSLEWSSCGVISFDVSFAGTT